MRRWRSWAAALFALGCASQPEYFRPTERSTAEGARGEPAASYDIRDDGGKLGEVTVWSQGAERGEVRGRDRTVVHIGIRVENLSSTPLRLDPRELRLEAIAVGSRLIADAELVALQPGGTNLEVPAASARDFDAYFAVSRGVSPNDLDSFRLRWSVLDGGRRFLQFTPFIEDETYGATWIPAYAYYYDPWIYDPFSYRRSYRQPIYLPVRRVVIREHGRPGVR